MNSRELFVNGGTGYIGSRLIPLLLARGHNRESALRLGLITLKQMLSALVNAVESPVSGIRILDVPQLRRADVNSGGTSER